MSNQERNAILERMLERLFAGLVNGPNLNCRPHSSRQRLDFLQLAGLQDVSPAELLQKLLGPNREATLTSRVEAPPPRPAKKKSSKGARDSAPAAETSLPTAEDAEQAVSEPEPAAQESTEDTAAQREWNAQQAVLRKLRIIADDSKTYEQDTGVHILQIGFPLLSLPPGSLAGSTRAGTKRVLAPLAFIPVTLTIRSGPVTTIEISCKQEGADLVHPNAALLAWIEGQTGHVAEDLFADETGEDPWREIRVIVEHVAKIWQLPIPDALLECLTGPPAAPSPPASSKQSGSKQPSSKKRGAANLPPAPTPPPKQPPRFELEPAPRSDTDDSRPKILAAAVLGLFPMNNQGLLWDMQALAAGETLMGPLESFVRLGSNLDQAAPAETDSAETNTPDFTEPKPEIPPAIPARERRREFSEERLVSAADPFQSRAVRLARECQSLVIHGPPGTGKSQTITNIIGDSLAKGERVLMVCDKRAALDVVAHRLEHLGLGSLCARIHDPQRDQKDLYKAIREQLDELTEVSSSEQADKQLAKLDAKLQRLHKELHEVRAALLEHANAHGDSFHELVGQWLATPAPATVDLKAAGVRDVARADFEQHEHDLQSLFSRAEKIDWARNPWPAAAGIPLEHFLTLRMETWRTSLRECVTLAVAADATRQPDLPLYSSKTSLSLQQGARSHLIQELKPALPQLDPALLARWSAAELEGVRRARQRLTEAAPHLEVFRTGPLDPELLAVVHGNQPAMATLNQELAVLEAFLAVARKWYSFVYWGIRSQAATLLSRYGIRLDAPGAERLQGFLKGLRARLILNLLRQELQPAPVAAAGLPPDAELERTLSQHSFFLDLQVRVADDPRCAGLLDSFRKAFTEPAGGTQWLERLEQSLPRAAALERLEQALAAANLFQIAWLDEFTGLNREGGEAVPTVTELQQRADTLDGVLRIQDQLQRLPPALAQAVQGVLQAGLASESALAVLHKGMLEAEIAARLLQSPELNRLDDERLEKSFEQYRTLEAQKKELVREQILHYWVTRQKTRLEVSTGSRLNSAGADLRRRMTLRGARGMRLRQVISVGQTIAEGDPLFDLRPVWMASPETVAQIFPRQPLFDVIIFDEASQCRLEEALPVLTRGKRAVIAGDPQQLPPTRFFESALVVSEEDEVATDQQLFESHQREIEDLLSAALSIEMPQCYLDVHYRSRNADLIEFSNQQFYRSRLQPIPGHPSHHARFAPVTLYSVNGVYEERSNSAEADQVCRIISDLLKRAEPPSIGVACFNLTQRDLILERLDELAQRDSEFAARLADARVRSGEATFEGLFVKNLENVQGDERDHIIISTTYGPDPQGKFHRRFGPLGRVGGGRRLNVIVTRARNELHLVTSIPPAAYRNLPPIPADQAPGGAWLLFAYIAFAEQLGHTYEQIAANATDTPVARPTVNIRPSRYPSTFAESLAKDLVAGHQLGSDVYWGNDGFCVDLAVHDPENAENVTIGILCDGTRFADAEDAIEWEIFRTGILADQGWLLHRLWTPHFFRDPSGSLQAIAERVKEFLTRPRDE